MQASQVRDLVLALAYLAPVGVGGEIPPSEDLCSQVRG